MSKLAIGKPVPAFALTDSAGRIWKLANARGKALLIYFYPRDNTPGCTTETAAFRDLYAQFQKAGCEIVGISADSSSSHEKFKAKLQVPFELLADPDHAVCRLFEVYKEKALYGRKYLGIERSTFLLDRTGRLHHEWRKVRVPGHAEAALAQVRTLKTG